MLLRGTGNEKPATSPLAPPLVEPAAVTQPKVITFPSTSGLIQRLGNQMHLLTMTVSNKGNTICS